MRANVNTYRLGTSEEVEADIAWAAPLWQSVSDQTARTIASWYHSPAPRDANLTALSHGRWFDTKGLREEIERDLDGAHYEAMIQWLDNLETMLS